MPSKTHFDESIHLHAVAEKLASLATLEYLEQRALRGNKDRFQSVLAKVPDVEPVADDKLSEDSGE